MALRSPPLGHPPPPHHSQKIYTPTEGPDCPWKLDGVVGGGGVDRDRRRGHAILEVYLPSHLEAAGRHLHQDPPAGVGHQGGHGAPDHDHDAGRQPVLVRRHVPGVAQPEHSQRVKH